MPEVKKYRPNIGAPRTAPNEEPAAERACDFRPVDTGFTKEDAIAEANRCLDCKKPLCMQGCPVGVNIPGFCKEFNERTKNDVGLIIPVVITVYADRSFTFITKTPPAAVLIKKACNIESGSGVPNKTKVATISKEDVRKIAETKMPDLNAASIEAAMSMIAGTARSMGIVVGD